MRDSNLYNSDDNTVDNNEHNSHDVAKSVLREQLGSSNQQPSDLMSGNKDRSYDAYDDVDADDQFVSKISAQEALELSKKQPGLPKMIRLLQVLILCMFGSAFVGFYKGYNLIKGLESYYAGAQEPIDYAQSLAAIAGPLADQGALGCALWFMISSICGGLGVIIPFAVYNFIARRGEQSRFPGTAGVMYDAIKAEVYKYSIMVLILGAVFKFTDLNDMITIATFVIMMCVQLVLSSYSLGFASQKAAQETYKSSSQGAANSSGDAAIK